jgi:hypothetical protein
MSWIDDIGPGEFFKGIADAMKGKSPAAPASKTTDISDDYEKNQVALKKLVAELKETTKTSKMLTTAFEGGKVAIPDFTENIKELDEAITQAKDEQEVEVLQARKRAMVRGQVEGTLKASAVNLATGFASAAYGLVLAGLDLTRGIIEGQDAITTATQAQIAQVKAQAKVGATIGEALGGLGPILAFLPGPFRLIGIALGGLLTVLGPFMKMASEKTAELVEKGLEILGAQLKQVRKGFFDLADSGVNFAGGMTEMTLTASRAGLRVEDFAKQVKESENNIREMGGGMSIATQRLAGISGEIRKGQLGRQLQNMGIQLTEQAKVAAAAAAQLNASGRLRSMSDAEVASYTVKYARDLKILQAVAGKDAEKAMEKARQESMAADIRAKILREGGQEALERFNTVFAGTPEELRKGLLEKISLGSVVDVGTNIAMQANKGIGTYFDRSAEIIYRGGKDFAEKFGVAKEQLGKSAENISEANRSIAQAGTAIGDPLLMAVRGINSAVTMIGVEVPEGTTKATAKIVDGAKATQDSLTNAVHKLDDASNKIAVGLQTKLLGAVTDFANKSAAALMTIEEALQAVHTALANMGLKAEDKKNQALDDKNRDHMFFGEMTRSYSKQIGANVVGLFSEKTAANMEKNRRTEETAQTKRREEQVKQDKINRPQMTIPEKLGSDLRFFQEDLLAFFGFSETAERLHKERIAQETQNLKKSESERGFFKNLTGFSRGGISNRPAIFGEKGPEAAVPLPDGRTIPVSFKGIDKFFQAAMKSLDPTNIVSKTVTGRSQPLSQSAPDGNSIMSAAKQINDQLVASLTGATTAPSKPGGTNRRESERTVDDIALIMESQLAKQETMIKLLQGVLAVNKGMLSAYS